MITSQSQNVSFFTLFSQSSKQTPGVYKKEQGDEQRTRIPEQTIMQI